MKKELCIGILILCVIIGSYVCLCQKVFKLKELVEGNRRYILVICVCIGMVTMFIMYKNKIGQQTKTVTKDTVTKDTVTKDTVTKDTVKKDSYSQDGQDKYLETHIFKGYKNGFFVDVGAHDGKSINNTLYFEENNNWTGVNIEPIKEVYNDLVVNRPNCININCAVSNDDGKTEFIRNTGYTEMISGIKNTFDTRHLERLKNENKQYGGSTEIIEVETKKLETICDIHKISNINYLSIDVEGAEFEVIKSINFDKVFIDVIGFENNFNDTSVPIVKYLEDRNYVVIHKSLDIFMIHKHSMFF